MAPKPKRGLDKRQKVWITTVVGIAVVLILTIAIYSPARQALTGEGPGYSLYSGGASGSYSGKTGETAQSTQQWQSTGCTGAIPLSAQFCAGDDTGFEGTQPNVLVNSCTTATKCEFTCLPNYVKIGNDCFATCTGGTPSHAQMCLGDEYPAVPTEKKVVDACTTTSMCEFTCNSGYGRGNDGSSCVACVSKPSGLVGWWRGENNYLDSSDNLNGNYFTGTYNSGKVGKAFYFAGAQNKLLRIPDSPALDISAELTVEAWVNPYSSPYYTGYIIRKGKLSELNGFELGYSEVGGAGISFLVNGHGINTPITNNQWSHVIATYRGIQGNPAETFVRIYINGIKEEERTGDEEFAGELPGAIGLNNEPLKVGYYFKGLIDEVSIYNRVLTDAEIQNLYNAGGAGKCLTT